MDTFQALSPTPNILAMSEFDVTEMRRQMRKQNRKGLGLSFQGMIIKAIASAVEKFPELNSVLKGRKLYIFDDIDFNIPLELEVEGIQFPRQLIIRQANRKTAEEISREIESARTAYREQNVLGKEDRWALRFMAVLNLFPGCIRRGLLKLAVKNPLTIKKNGGTIHYTSVAGISQCSGFVIPIMTSVHSVDFTLGSITAKPVYRNGTAEEREILSITIMFNHGVIDGAPASRFVNCLKHIIEQGKQLSEMGKE